MGATPRTQRQAQYLKRVPLKSELEELSRTETVRQGWSEQTQPPRRHQARRKALAPGLRKTAAITAQRREARQGPPPSVARSAFVKHFFRRSKLRLVTTRVPGVPGSPPRRPDPHSLVYCAGRPARLSEGRLNLACCARRAMGLRTA